MTIYNNFNRLRAFSIFPLEFVEPRKDIANACARKLRRGVKNKRSEKYMMGLKTQLVPMLLLEFQNSYLYLYYMLFNISVTLSAKHELLLLLSTLYLFHKFLIIHFTVPER